MPYALCPIPLAFSHKLHHRHAPFFVEQEDISVLGVIGDGFEGFLEFDIDIRGRAGAGRGEEVDKPHLVGASALRFAHDQVAAAMAFKLGRGGVKEEVHLLGSFSFNVILVEFNEFPVGSGQGRL